MKIKINILSVLLLTGLLITGNLNGQSFDSGSQGTEALVVSENTTLDLPPDGILEFTELTVNAGRVLTFRANALNTPVTILTSGDVTINGSIRLNGNRGNNVSGGLPGPGGFPGGNPATADIPPGDGYGPGAGKAGAADFSVGAGTGSFATRGSRENDGAVYGNALLIPVVGGSGGGGTEGNPGSGGGGGGGALLIASSTQIEISASGRLMCNGGSALGANNAGSGGSVRLVAPRIIGNGGVNCFGGGSQAGAGRIRLDTLDRSQLSLTFSPNGITSIGSMMVVFPEPLPRLDIVRVADRDIAVGSGPVVIQRPFGGSPNVNVTVQASNFGANVPISVVLTPDSGPSISVDATVNNSDSNPGTAIVPVVLPLNVQTTINVWTR